MKIGDSIKVFRLSGNYSKYLSIPRREGIVIDFPQESSATIAFPASKVNNSPYYDNIHTYQIKNMKVTKHNKTSQIGIKLDRIREQYKIKEEDMK